MAYRRQVLGSILAAALLAGGLSALTGGDEANAATLPAGFQEHIAITGLTQPTNVEFAADGRVFVAEKRGVIKVYDTIGDTTPTVFADLQAVVHNQWDRGLIGLALAPNFPADPYVYVAYTYDFNPLTQTSWNDRCASMTDGSCVVLNRVSRLRAAGNQMTGPEQVLLTDWCQLFPSHAIGDVKFGPDGKLYVSGGDGASYWNADLGESGTNPQACGDTAGEGGAFRSQDVRTVGDAADPTTLDGSIIRIEPATGAPAAGNPLSAHPNADANAKRVVAHGLRNPFRFAFRPGTSEAWISDVGWATYEEINRVTMPGTRLTNLGWPCYEAQVQTYPADHPVCASIRTAGEQVAPVLAYHHANKLTPTDTCRTGTSAIGALAFYPKTGGSYPAEFKGALFFADYARQCIFVMGVDAQGVPTPSLVSTFATSARTPVDLAIGTSGDLYYVDLSGTVRRIRYYSGNQPPIANLDARPTSGAAPLTVAFDGRASTDADPADQPALSYAWDFTNDGTVDATTPTASHTYPEGIYTARLTVRDPVGATSTATIPIASGNLGPTAIIDTPTGAANWKVGDRITFSGRGTDPQDGDLYLNRFEWELNLHHCYSLDNCHIHPITTWASVSSGDFEAPDHDYPSYLELKLTVTDFQGLKGVDTVRLDPKTVDVTFATSPPGLELTVGATAQVTPFTRTLIAGSTSSVSARSAQPTCRASNQFAGWSDGGAQSHAITAPDEPATITATYASTPGNRTLSGKVVSSAGSRPISGAAVTLLGCGLVAKTGTDGRYSFPGLVDGTYQVQVAHGSGTCGPPYVQSVPVVGGSVTVDIRVPRHGADTGYSCVETPRKYLPGRDRITVVPPAEATVGLPFSFRYFGQSHSAMKVSATGTVSFGQSATVTAFRADKVVPSSAAVYTAVAGTAPNRVMVVEWRDVKLTEDPAGKFSAEIVLAEDGTITVAYSGVDTAAERAAVITAGVEGPKGGGIRVTGPRKGTGFVFTPPGKKAPAVPTTGSLSGTVTDAVTGAPIAGAQVTLKPGNRTATTSGSGRYEFTDVPFGGYTLAARRGGALATARVAVPAQEAVDVTLSTVLAPGANGYTVATKRGGLAKAGTVTGLRGDDRVLPVSLPFGVPFHGQRYQKLWISTDGRVTFAAPGPTTEAVPGIDAAFDDLVVDAGSSVRTGVVGTGSHREYVVEWRDVRRWAGGPRFSAQLRLGADGTVTIAYAGAGVPGTAKVGLVPAGGATGPSGDPATLSDGATVTFTPAP